jgi:hypothetical protein
MSTTTVPKSPNLSGDSENPTCNRQHCLNDKLLEVTMQDNRNVMQMSTLGEMAVAGCLDAVWEMGRALPAGALRAEI